MDNGQPLGPTEIAIILGIVLFVLAVVLIISAILCYMNYRLIADLPEPHRKIKPGLVWLLMIPIFNIVWNFVVFIQIPESYQNYFDSVGDTSVGDAGRSLGLWFAILAAVGNVPYVGCLAGPAALVLLILYFVKMFGYRAKIIQAAKPQPIEG